MKAPLHDIALWAGAAAMALAAHVAAGVWLSQIEARPGNGLVAAMPVEIVLEAAPAADIPPDIPPQIMPEAAPSPVTEAAPEPATVPDTAPDPPAPDMPAPDLAEAPPDHAPPPSPPPEVTEPAVAMATPPALPDITPAPAFEPPPDAVALPQPAGIAPPDPVEALPDIQPPPPPPEVEAEPEAKAVTDIAVANPPPARPERIAQRAARPEPARKAPAPESTAAAPAPAPAATPTPAAAPTPAPAAAPSAGEIDSWKAQVQSRVARHMARTRLPSLRGRVQASLHLSVAANGAVSASLASSSGNPDADAALQRQAGSLPALPPPPGGKGVTLILPVVISPS